MQNRAAALGLPVNKIVLRFKSDSTMQSITMDGNKEIKTPQHRLLLYPNPAQQQLTLATDDTKLQEVNLILYDLTGKKVAVFGQVLTNHPLQLGAMAAGLYIAEIEAGGTTERQKLVIRQ